MSYQYVITDDAKWFYEELGYALVAEDWAGVDNPEWKGDPVPVRTVSRVDQESSRGHYADVVFGNRW